VNSSLDARCHSLATVVHRALDSERGSTLRMSLPVLPVGRIVPGGYRKHAGAHADVSSGKFTPRYDLGEPSTVDVLA